MNIIDKLKWRYAVKKMNGQALNKDQLSLLEEAVRLTPSSYGLQPYRLIVVSDPVMKQHLQEASYNQEKVSQSSHMFVFATLDTIDEPLVDRFITLTTNKRNTQDKQLQTLKDSINAKVTKLNADNTIQAWAKNQAYIALGNLMTVAATMGIDTCPMEGFMAHEYDHILGLKDRNLSSVVVCAVGFRSDDDNHRNDKKVRWDQEEFSLHL